ncbi:MAG TPA: DUF2161 family putative PD-(D/E)XK-type phosphodiesterase [Bacillota bacterium]|mgnify:CR=1 FL=1|jgi:hypothetical protein|nr:DUF2161 family putative PD-(D/E)XK-type phosphodiesterase [Bacillota bacterium]HRS20174.1 DUF2161 family putative PD-(D/E)XK-type phosphodiesterase [Clostridia bacterium]HRU40335.1 DUF2161 family putative PD-(D/E)XK-type phosphodiesterase [Candidatus Diapherotrites archaeon]HOS69172.1 DUF2161 family putative PD-(D/E)XK-type phosphodiesterase [Bacillota bacterium]HQE65884.1 DUF2161 family putative PD-(D/E)XK-type phosphodiesterase [Bacillota bacterium]
MSSGKKEFFEKDLYKPVYDYLSGLGYTVRSEVNHCDIAAIKGDELLVVEMKKTLNLDVILQAVQRQKLADMVYIAVPKPGRGLFSKRWQSLCYMLKRLQLGLIVVSLKEDCSFAEVVFEPAAFDMIKSKNQSKKKRQGLIKEFAARYGDFNTGGSSRQKLVTAYREMAIHIACCLMKYGQLKPRELRQLGTDEKKTTIILEKNHYGWFENISKGLYAINEKGKKEAAGYSELYQYYMRLVEEKNEREDK